MRLAVKDSLTEQEIESGLRALIKDGMPSTSKATLTEGVFLVAFVLKLWALNLMIGLLAALPPGAQLIQVPSMYLFEEIRNKRAISVSASSGSGVLWLFIFRFQSSSG